MSKSWNVQFEKLRKVICLVLELRKRKEASVAPTCEKNISPISKKRYVLPPGRLASSIEAFFLLDLFLYDAMNLLTEFHAFWSPFDSGLIFLCEGQHTESKLARSVSTSNQDGWSMSGIDPYGVVRPRQKSQFVRSFIGLRYFFFSKVWMLKSSNKPNVSFQTG